MTTLTLTLSDADREFIEVQAAKSGHGDAIGYVRSLIDQERARAERLEFEESLREALHGEATLMTKEDWEDIRREGMRLIEERKTS